MFVAARGVQIVVFASSALGSSNEKSHGMPSQDFRMSLPAQKFAGAMPACSERVRPTSIVNFRHREIGAGERYRVLLMDA
jgi:hypothetical protein